MNGPGAGEHIQRLRMAIAKAVDEDAMVRIFKGLIKKAESGDLAAIRMLLAYTVGEPKPNQPLIAIVNQVPESPKKVKALPRTSEKMQVLEHRAGNGQKLFSKSDPSTTRSEED